jgi:RNA-directed DNA polymerase
MSSVNLPSNELINSIYQNFGVLNNLNEFSVLLTKIERELIFKNAETKPKAITAKHLLYLSKHSDEKYKDFTIPKKSGGTRKIESPDQFLKRIQSTINALFQIIFHEKMNHHANGFILNRSIKRNALPHVQKRYVLNIDIKDFFPSIEFRRVKTVLEFAPFNLAGQRETIGFVVSNICCLNGRLPQGAPTSPIISNIVTQRLDRRMARLSSEHRVKYSRYADDLSFSANRNAFTNEFIDEVRNLIEGENFSVNEDKTRVKSNRDHQEVTGIVVNQKLNVRRSYLKTVRTMLNNWEKGGLEYAENEFHFNEPHKALNNFQNVLGGRIGYIGLVRGIDDPLFQRLNIRFSLLKHKVDYSDITNDSVKRQLIREDGKNSS